MPHIIYSCAKKLFLAVFIACIGINIIIAQTNQVQVSAVWDPTGPNLVNLSPLDTYQDSSTILNWSAASNAGYYTAEVSTSSSFTSLVTSLTTSALTVTFTNLPEGVLLYYRIIPYTSDAHAGLASNTVSATTDKSPPVTSVNSATVNNDKIVINFSSTDNLSGVSNVYLYYRFNNGNWINYGGITTSSPFSFVPEEGSGKYDFLSIGKDNVENTEIKSFNPEASVNYSFITQTPTPVITPTVTPTSPVVSPTQEIPTTPLPSSIPENGTPVEIYSIPNSKIIIETLEGKYQYTVDNTGLFRTNIKSSMSIKVKIYDEKNNFLFSKVFINPDKISFIIPPIFHSYYIIHSVSKRILEVTGKAFPNSEVQIFNIKRLNKSQLTTHANQNGDFIFDLDIYDIQDSLLHSSLYDDTSTDLKDISLYNFNTYGISIFNNMKSDKSKEVIVVITLAHLKEKSKNTNLLNILNTPAINLIDLPRNILDNIKIALDSITIFLNILFFIPILMIILFSFRYRLLKNIYFITRKNTLYIDEYLSNINLRYLYEFAENIVLLNILSLSSSIAYFVFTYSIVSVIFIFLNLLVLISILICKFIFIRQSSRL